MKILFACQFTSSGRDAARKRGHDAWPCDFLPSEGNPEWHIQGDVLNILDRGWDAVIAMPTCTYLANSGAKHLYIGQKKENGICPDRWQKMLDGAAFFNKFKKSAIRVCIENPIMHCHASALCGKPTQYVQPWMFGHSETKATGLHLDGLMPLRPTNIVEGREARIHRMPPGPDRQKERSRSYDGIMEAMVDQWF